MEFKHCVATPAEMSPKLPTKVSKLGQQVKTMQFSEIGRTA